MRKEDNGTKVSFLKGKPTQRTIQYREMEMSEEVVVGIHGAGVNGLL